MKKIDKLYIKNGLIKSLVATLLYIIAYQFYSIEIVRNNIEDIAFDITNKFYINYSNDKDYKKNSIYIFKIDKNYLISNGLMEKNETNYGYIFPRDKIAEFIDKIDRVSEKNNLPKALFIDYDFSYSSVVGNKILSKEDIKLLSILGRTRDYTILLPKTSIFNFVEQCKSRYLTDYNETIEKICNTIEDNIKKQKIVFTSVAFLENSSDNAIRRYKTSVKIDGKNYINTNIVLWYLSKYNKIPTNNDINFSQSDIIKNRILIKGYQKDIIQKINIKNNIKEDIKISKWSNLKIYSANTLENSIENIDINNSIIMIGNTINDRYQILNVLGNNTLSGIELHANILNTLYFFDGQLDKISIWIGATIVFVTFLILYFIVPKLLNLFKIYKKSLAFLFVLIINTLVLFLISLFFLKYYHLWFNWFIPIIIFELSEVIDFIEDYSVAKIPQYFKGVEDEKD